MDDLLDLIARDPVTNETFPPNAHLDATMIFLIARRWLRVRHGPDAKDDNVPYAQRRASLNAVFKGDELQCRANRMDELWTSLLGKGIEFEWEKVTLAGAAEKRWEHQQVKA
jgi:hypothetical protein